MLTTIAKLLARRVLADQACRAFGETGVEFREIDLFAYARGKERADETGDNFALKISIIATDILKRDIEVLMVLPKVPTGQPDLE